MPYPRHSVTQLPADSVGECVDFIKHDRLVFKLTAHVIRLLSQVPNRTENTIQLLILLVKEVRLALLLH